MCKDQNQPIRAIRGPTVRLECAMCLLKYFWKMYSIYLIIQILKLMITIIKHLRVLLYYIIISLYNLYFARRPNCKNVMFEFCILIFWSINMSHRNAYDSVTRPIFMWLAYMSASLSENDIQLFQNHNKAFRCFCPCLFTCEWLADLCFSPCYDTWRMKQNEDQKQSVPTRMNWVVFFV